MYNELIGVSAFLFQFMQVTDPLVAFTPGIVIPNTPFHLITKRQPFRASIHGMTRLQRITTLSNTVKERHRRDCSNFLRVACASAYKKAALYSCNSTRCLDEFW